MTMFLEDLERVKAQTEAALQAQAAAEREQARLEAELVRERAKVVRLEEELERAREEQEQATRQTAELRAVAARLPLLGQQRDAEKVRADQLSQKLETAKGLLDEAAEREKTLAATVADRVLEVGRLNGELESSRVVVEASRVRVEADRVLVTELGKL